MKEFLNVWVIQKYTFKYATLMLKYKMLTLFGDLGVIDNM